MRFFFFFSQSDTLNPFDVNGQIFNALNGNVCDNEKETSSDKERKDDENNVVLSTEQMALLDDQRLELADLRRQVVFLQVSKAGQFILNFLSLCFASNGFVDKQTDFVSFKLCSHQSKLVN